MLPVICLMGPTASGKTRLAMQLAEHLPVDLISADSAMVYRGMDMGTAKPTLAEQEKVPHRLLDIRDPKEPYSAGQFYQDALREIQHSHERQRIPLLVGGTMLYFHVLQQGFSTLPSADPKLRENIYNEAQVIGWPAIHEKLKAVDPQSAREIHPNDAQRIQRALEVYYLTQQPLSELHIQQQISPLSYDFINVILNPEDRAALHQRIVRRWKEMIEKGFIEEVKQLYNRGDLHPDLPALRTVGYRQVWGYLAGEYDYTMMEEKAVAATRQLAKRQLTWLRRWPNAIRFNSEDPDLLKAVLAYLNRVLP